MIAALFVLSLASSSPPPIADPADAPTTPVAPATPPTSAPTTTTTPPATTTSPTSPQAPTKTPVADARAKAKASEALDPTLVGVMQGAMFCVASGVALPCALAAPGGLCLACMVPLATGYAATFVADRWGPSRAPAIGPIIASYVASCGSAAAIIGVFAAVLVQSNGNPNPNDPTATLGAIGAGAAVLLAGAVAVPVVYSLTAVDKAPGDDGADFPGWFSAAHPKEAPVGPTASTPAPKRAMYY